MRECDNWKSKEMLKMNLAAALVEEIFSWTGAIFIMKLIHLQNEENENEKKKICWK